MKKYTKEELIEFIKNFIDEDGYDAFENIDSEYSEYILGYNMNDGVVLLNAVKLFKDFPVADLPEDVERYIDESAVTLVPITADSHIDLIRKLNDEGCESSTIFDGSSMNFYSAAIGYDALSSRVIYDYNKMIEYLIEEMYKTAKDVDGLSREEFDEDDAYSEAVDFISYNTMRAIPYMGPIRPIIIDRQLPV